MVSISTSAGSSGNPRGPAALRRLGLIICMVMCLSYVRLAALDPGRRAGCYTIHGWFTDPGLPSNKIRAAAQTRDGYLWVATGQGIARFDGVRFTAYTVMTNPELRGGGFLRCARRVMVQFGSEAKTVSSTGPVGNLNIPRQRRGWRTITCGLLRPNEMAPSWPARGRGFPLFGMAR
jgi:ligand-binding sensor domain-containing protein